MSVVIDRYSLSFAEDVFKNLGIALTELQIYKSDHPHFKNSAQALREHIVSYFKKHDKIRHLTFVRKKNHIEFQNVPLVNVGNHGERLLGVLKNADFEAIQILPEIQDEQLLNLLEALLAASGKITDANPLDDFHSREHGFRFFKRVSTEQYSLLDMGLGSVEADGGVASFEIPGLKISEATSRSVLATYRSLLAGIESGQQTDYSLLSRATSEVVDLFAGRSQPVIPSTFQSYFDDFTFHHSVNVCLLVSSIVSDLVTDEDLLRQITLAALLHDIGKSRVPAEILHKAGRLSDAEFDELKRHPVIGAEILMGIDGIDPMCVAVAFTHHMHSAENSYPKTSESIPLDWITKLVAVADIYEALVAARPYKQGLSSKKAFEIMLSMPGLKKRHGLVKLLFNKVGPYPTGALVELATGERAVVTEQNPANPLRPKITVLTDPEKNVLEEPRPLNLAEPSPETGEFSSKEIAEAIVIEQETADPLTQELNIEPDEILGCPLTDDAALMAREG